MQDNYFPLCKIPQTGTFGVVGAYFGNISCKKVGLVTPPYKGVVTLNMLVPKHVLCLLECLGSKYQFMPPKLNFQVSTKDLVVIINSLSQDSDISYKYS